MSTNRRTALAYVRQSQSREDQDESLSLSFQERRIRDYSDRNNLEVVGVYSDLDVSGNIEARKGLDAMLEHCDRGGIEVIAIYNISRLARDTLLFLKICKELERRRIALVSASESMEDRTVVTVISAFAERERIQLSNTIAWAVRESAKRGKMTQGPPFGYKRVNGDVLTVASEADLVRRIFAAYASGQTTGEILNALHRDRIPTPTGLPIWQRTTLTRMLGNRAYNGEIAISESRDPIGRVRPALLTNGNHEAIIPPETFDRVQAILASERPIRRVTKFPAPWLAGAMNCSACGARLYLEILRSKPDRLQPYWTVRCASSRRAANTSKPTICDGQSVGAFHLIEPVARRALARDLSSLIDPGAAYALAVESSGEHLHKRGDELRAIIEETDERLARLWLARETGDITIELYRQRHAVLSAQKESAAAELATVPVVPEIGTFALARAVLSEMADEIIGAEDAQLREWVSIMGAVVTVDVREKTAAWTYDPPYSILICARVR